MNIFQISIKNIRSKPLNAVLNISLFATGIFIISLLFLLKKQFENQLEKNVAGIDLVVGAKGSPLQLILSSIYHADYPVGNVLQEEAERLKRNPLVKKTIPLALGDSYHGYRIVGTNHDYPALYGGKLKEGVLWDKVMEATIGSKVAKKTGLKVGDEFSGVHGFVENTGHAHDEFNYKVAGIFNETGTVLDQLVLTNLENVWAIHSVDDHGDEETSEHRGEECSHEDHEHTDACEHDHKQPEEFPHEITSMLVFFKNPMGAISLPRNINKNTNMQAASPAIEINRLYSLMGTSIEAVSMIAYLIMFISAFSIFISLFNSMKERKYELALIRVLGGGKGKIFALVVIEGLITALIGFVVGFLMSRAGLMIISSYTESNFNYSLSHSGNFGNDILLLSISLVIGFVASVIPAMKAMNTDISKTLSR